MPLFHHAVASLVIVSSCELFTKTYAKKFIFIANQMGCEFIGHPLVERVKGRLNFKTWSNVIDKPLEEIEHIQIVKLLERLSKYTFIEKSELNLLVLHAGHKALSNTLMYWDYVKSNFSEEDLAKMKIEELHVEEGKITDCYGCGFETCTYYSMEKSCFYGGFVVASLFPMIEKADIVVWICPNYNDAISAKLMAVVNRLTALYRKISFNDKYILSIVVSGNSGNDTVAGQLIGALNINKGFRLPPFFAAMAIANNPGEIKTVLEGDNRANDYVNNVHELTNKIVSKI
ncbi:MAG TPA: FMN reductase [Clostridiales bacterium UBA8960]|nr:FMN reductase [Clostridiales bacterium UBA8960]